MKPFKVLGFLFISLLILIGITFLFPEGEINIAPNFTINYPSFQQLYKKKVKDERTVEEIAKFRQDSIRVALRNAKRMSILDSLKLYESFDVDNPASLYHPDKEKIALYVFFGQMDSLSIKDTAAHVLHYGDSQIEMDRITGYLRERFQALWGGNGPGFVTPKPLTPGYNLSHFFSDNWSRKVPFGPLSFRAKHYRYGPLCTVCSFDSAETATVSIRARKKSTEGVKKFDVFKVIYKGNVNVSASGNRGNKEFSIVPFSNGIKMGVWSFDTFQSKASFSFQGDSLSEVYGISLESKKGVYLDNVPMRGASGTFFSVINKTLLKESLVAINSRLIILEFGGNVMPVIHSKKKAEWYGRKMKKQIEHFKEIRPEATILFIGPADMQVSKGGVTQTHPYLETVIGELKRNVLEAGGIYWDMYSAMGGNNSMKVWQNNKPKLGSSDGIHFTKKGANTIARMLFETIENEYIIYKMKQRLISLNEGN